MSDTNIRLRTLHEIAETNPETLSANTSSNYRFRYIDLSAVEAGCINWGMVAETNFGSAPSRARRVAKPLDVLFGTVRPNLKSHGFIGEDQLGDFVASTGFSVIRAMDGVSYPAYLFHSLMSDNITAQAIRDAVGSSYPALNDGDIKSFQLFVPSYEDQKVIAQILDTLDTAIRETEAIIAKLKAVKQGLLHDLLTRGIDINGELRPPQPEAPHLYKRSPLGWIPKDWNIKRLDELADIKSGSTPARSMGNRYFNSNGFAWVKTLDLNEDAIQDTDEKITSAAIRESSCTLFPIGTVLIAMYGGWEQIGRTAILGIEAASNQAISALCFSSENVFPEFVLRAIQHGRQRWKKVAASTRKDPNITKADVDGFAIALPLNLNEQIRIVGEYRALLDRLNSEQAASEKFKQAKSGLMNDLLTGRVRVTPLLDPVAI